MELKLPWGSATITVNKRIFPRSCGGTKSLQSTQNRSDEEFYATIKAVFKNAPSPSVLVAHMRQVNVQYGFCALSPVVSVCNIVPRGSPIFEVVTSGGIEELQKFLARGDGTLRDRDDRGTPLLHVGRPDVGMNSRFQSKLSLTVDSTH